MKIIHLSFICMLIFVMGCLVVPESFALSPVKKWMTELDLGDAPGSGAVKLGVLLPVEATGTTGKFFPPIGATGTTGKAEVPHKVLDKFYQKVRICQYRIA